MKKNVFSLCGFLMMALSLFLQIRLIFMYIVDRNMLLPTWWEEVTYICVALCYCFVYQLGTGKARKIYSLHIVAGIQAVLYALQVFFLNNVLHWIFHNNHLVGIRFEDGWCSYARIAEEDIKHGLGRYILAFALLYVGCKVIDAVYLKKEFVHNMMAKLRARRTHSHN